MLKLRHATLLLLTFALCLGASGCFLVAAGAAGAAGAYAYHGNRLESVEGASIQTTANAAEAGLRDLGITVGNKAVDSLTGKVEGSTAQGKQVTIDLKRREDAITEVNIRVGSGFLTDEKDQATAIMEAMRKRLGKL